MLPATLPLLITLISLEMGSPWWSRRSCRFVGLGVRPDQPAWGQMIADARQYMYQSPWDLLLPMVAIFLTVTAFNLLGDGLRRALDVRLSRSGALTCDRPASSRPVGRRQDRRRRRAGHPRAVV